MDSQKIRSDFIKFFESKDHRFVPSSSVAPLDDPTLLFTNAGMNQFKDVFLGTGTRPYKRAVNTQKCIRVSGKHNDLEEVGRDGYHHTFFEMLGTWSFGDYYKREAIQWAWELFTQVWKFDKTKLYATVYQDDKEALALWRGVTDINPEHVLRFGEKDNFWEMGETGPCGPCSEIHIDLGTEACTCKDPKTCGVNSGCARYRELWNLVFIQYNRDTEGRLHELPAKHVDTGAGLERICALIQGKNSNYETDLFMPIIKKTEELSGRKYSSDERGTPFRVIADHLRMVAFSITDGAIPSNEGRGYVVRRILRRGFRFGRQLGFTQPFLYQLVDTLVEIIGEVFSGLKEKKEYTKKIIEAEETSFNRTLDNGIQLFEEAIRDIKGKVFPGEAAFKLYDTYGFPVDLTELMAEEKGLKVDMSRFNSLLEQQKTRARAAGISEVKKGIGGEIILDTDNAAEKQAMACNHTSTHLLHAALQKVLGSHATQKGSQVTPEKLRFDFSHFEALTAEQLKKVEELVNAEIQKNIKLSIVTKKYAEAKQEGAMSLFGEKYGDTVRVVSIGDFSKELCGGGHVTSTGELQVFKIIKESSISAGVRRIEAVTGKTAVDAYNRQQAEQEQAEQEKIRQKANQKKHEKEKLQVMLKQLDQYTDQKEIINGVPVLLVNIGEASPDIVRTIAHSLVNYLQEGVVLIASQDNAKPLLMARVTPKYISGNFDAAKLIKKTAPAINGGGGGKPDQAQAGGKDSQGLDKALWLAREFIQETA